MPAPSDNRKNRSLLETVSKWLVDMSRMSGLAELQCSAEDEVGRIAKEFGLSALELRNLVSRGPEAADLLISRLEALDLNRREVALVESQALRDMERVCSLCQSKRRCRKDLARNPIDPVWEHYCPNVATLKALDALPWSARQGW